MSLYAEDVNYWKTSRSDPDSWIEKTVRLITEKGGVVHHYGAATINGSSAFQIEFSIDSDTFRIKWPALKTQTGETRATKVQAATMMYHDVKAKLMNSLIFGAKAGFIQYLLVDGETVSERQNQETIGKLFRLEDKRQRAS